MKSAPASAARQPSDTPAEACSHVFIGLRSPHWAAEEPACEMSASIVCKSVRATRLSNFAATPVTFSTISSAPVVAELIKLGASSSPVPTSPGWSWPCMTPTSATSQYGYFSHPWIRTTSVTLPVNGPSVTRDASPALWCPGRRPLPAGPTSRHDCLTDDGPHRIALSPGGAAPVPAEDFWRRHVPGG